MQHQQHHCALSSAEAGAGAPCHGSRSSSDDVNSGGGFTPGVGSLGFGQGDDAGQQQQQQQQDVGSATGSEHSLRYKRSNQELETKSNDASEHARKRKKVEDSAVTGTQAAALTEAEAATAATATRRSARSRTSLRELPGGIIRVDGLVRMQADSLQHLWLDVQVKDCRLNLP
jgi:hypothetical protein